MKIDDMFGKPKITQPQNVKELAEWTARFIGSCMESDGRCGLQLVSELTPRRRLSYWIDATGRIYREIWGNHLAAIRTGTVYRQIEKQFGKRSLNALRGGLRFNDFSAFEGDSWSSERT